MTSHSEVGLKTRGMWRFPTDALAFAIYSLWPFRHPRPLWWITPVRADTAISHVSQRCVRLAAGPRAATPRRDFHVVAMLSAAAIAVVLTAMPRTAAPGRRCSFPHMARLASSVASQFDVLRGIANWADQ